jgi:hypothetical protein
MLRFEPFQLVQQAIEVLVGDLRRDRGDPAQSSGDREG